MSIARCESALGVTASGQQLATRNVSTSSIRPSVYFNRSSAPIASRPAYFQVECAKKNNGKQKKYPARKGGAKAPTPGPKAKRMPKIAGYTPQAEDPNRVKTAAELEYERLTKEGATVYAIFARARGPNQWFPVGPMAIPEGGDVETEIFKAEKDLVKAAVKMYPALTVQKNTIGLEYGFRLRDAPQLSEAEIFDSKADPFANVEVAVKPVGGPSLNTKTSDQNVVTAALRKLEQMFSKN
mmetsp:Transcript_26762/g.32485  ORF Transcript_26762/g.32485 Transcript_26762/m.32485 type:complete len:240 (+) Transcript_26762:60-779(+)|eukprot:CAMPEP_0197851712 /NCGR_PEP_ID=MMETSP1438-20131217/18685_1 /TAXON_ID=1461541 /ORGANISM="Pterosperma sp., Strain CCMP1384" /LENGTH=239 /DNA_ID=CAMNT_0043465419 /DNA_START=60 /DNA_END=779 /DNA_ORIENTATION=+